MISCIVIDDEKRALDTFQKISERYFSNRLKVLAMATSVRDGVKVINEFDPDVVFLDIEMPLENGFRLFTYFKEITFGVVFLTAYKHYAIEAIRYAAFDYLLKPLDIDDLSRVLMRYEKKNNSVQQVERIQALMSNLGVGSEIQNRIALPTPTGYRMERLSNIVYCQADENYSIIHTISGESILVTKTLKALEDIFPAGHFFRIHKSFLINLNFVKEYSRGEEHYVLLEDGTSLEVATRRHDEFVRMLTQRKT